MTTPIGGVRDRLIRYALHAHVQSILVALGWFDTGRDHSMINLIAHPIARDEEIPPNTVAVFIGDLDSEDTELGSPATNDRHPAIVDVYAETETLGLEITGDIRAALLGQMPTLDYHLPVVPVFDPREATPPILFYLYVDQMRRDRAPVWRDLHDQFWFSLMFDLTDEAVLG